MRFLTPDDGDLLVDLVQRLSRGDPLPALPRQHGRRTDRGNSPATAAVSGCGWRQQRGFDRVGRLSRRARAPSPWRALRRRAGETEAEAAVVVRDDWHRQGVGCGPHAPTGGCGSRSVGISRFTAMIAGRQSAGPCHDQGAGAALRKPHRPGRGLHRDLSRGNVAMKAVVMAGGSGSRLRPMTVGRPKPMLPLVNQVVLGPYPGPVAHPQDHRCGRDAAIHGQHDRGLSSATAALTAHGCATLSRRRRWARPAAWPTPGNTWTTPSW